eukprot:TRINITY_DN81077_c0_g1_i1.p1 TRINITY_DN81077_c0_g1~~TRINITY_DN81077_c0_g1_i1.p1  ORF type:complete len:524 (-),score=87.09 TRINITY_DN81077_c0_g1_i1:61-1632(-)
MGAGASAAAAGPTMTVRRIAFTKQIDEAIPNGPDAIKAVEDEVLQQRKQLIVELRGDLSEPDRKVKSFGVTLLQAHALICSTLRQAGDNAAKLWKCVPRCYEGEVKCGEAVIPLGTKFDCDVMLVVTPLSVNVYSEYIQGSVAKKPTCVYGPPGTGKVESLKDACRMTGREPVVVCATSGVSVTDAIKENIPEDEFTPIIVEEAHNLDKEHLDELATLQKERGFWLFVTSNIMLEDFLNDTIQFILMTIPPMTAIFDTLLACQGFTESSALAAPLASLLDVCRKDLAQEKFYDFGLRAAHAASRIAGQCGKESGWADEKGALNDACIKAFWTSCTAADKPKLEALIEKHIGNKPSIPASFTDGDRWAKVGAQLELVLSVRHCAMIINVGSDDLDACLAVLGDVGKKSDCKITRIEGAVADMDMSAMFGKMEGDAWIDGKFTAAFRSACQAGKEWLVLVCGDLSDSASAVFEPLHTVCDDNKELTLASGEILKMQASNKVVILAKDCDKFSPATVSRYGRVYTD